MLHKNHNVPIETGRKGARGILNAASLLVLFCFFHFKTVELYFPSPCEVLYPAVFCYVLAAAVLCFVVCNVKWMAAYFEVKIIALFLCWNLLLNVYYGVFSVAVFFDIAAMSLMCFCAPLLFKSEKEERVVFCVAFLPYLAVRTVTMLYGFVTFLTRISIYFTKHGPASWMDYNTSRLNIVFHPNTTASLYAICALFCVMGFFMFRAKWLKGVFSVVFVLSCAIIVLTRSRAGLYAFIAVLAVLMAAFVFLRMGQRFTWKALLAAGLAGAMTAVVMFAFSTITVAQFDALQAPTVEPQVQKFYDELTWADFALVGSNQQNMLDDDDLSFLGRYEAEVGSLNGRTNIWNGAFALIAHNPKILIKGAHVDNDVIMMQIEHIAGRNYGHLHSSYMHVLMAYGLPGVCLWIAFLLFIGLRCAYCLLQEKNASVMVYAGIILMILIQDAAETYLVQREMSIVPMVFAYCCGMICHKTPDYSFSKLCETIVAAIPRRDNAGQVETKKCSD